MVNNQKVGVSLSGGGYRGSAFHLGMLRKLHEMGILNKVDVISTISGGSITGACLCLNKKGFDDFISEMEHALTTKNVIKFILLSPRTIPIYIIILAILASLFYFPFTHVAWVSVIILAVSVALIIKFQFKLFPVSAIIEKAYDKFFYKQATLSDLCELPLLAIGSTNIQTCRPFTFSKNKMEDSSYAYRKPPIKFKHENFPVARAVMASSCVPFAFTPISIDKKYFVDEADAEQINPQLVDGGVYDNQGIQKITQRGSSYECDVIITSDAGNKLPFSESYNNAFVLLLRTMDVFMARIKNFQMAQNLFNNTHYANKSVAYLSLGWDIENCIPGFVDNLAAGNITKAVIEAHAIKQEWLNDISRYRNEIIDMLETEVNYPAIKAKQISSDELSIARKVGTNLTCLSMQQVRCLSGHAACMTELQVKLYCPSFFK